MRVVWLVAILMLVGGEARAWRSSLYPADWSPGFSDGEGRFLHDFSYAGYHSGADALPEIPFDGVDVTEPPYNADPTGAVDSTDAIQRAIDDVGIAGGGIVLLPAGTFRVSVPEGKRHALTVSHSHVVIKGAGPTLTHLLSTTTNLRAQQVIWIGPTENYDVWYWHSLNEVPFSADVTTPTTIIPVANVSTFYVGEWVILRSDASDAFIAEHGMTGTWTSADTGGPIFYRRIEAIDADTNTITVDIPTRYPLMLRDNARVHRVPPHISEIGLEDFSIGNLQNDTPGTGDDDYGVEGTGGYEMADSYLIYINHVVDGWVRRVETYKPPENSLDVQLLSNGLRLDFARNITVDTIHFQKPQYKGEGGNGYMVVMTGQENLVTHATCEFSRHNFTFSFLQASGNVLHRSTARSGRLPVDFHQRLAFSNLIDNLSIDDDSIEASLRECCNHGHSTTQTAMWNTHGISYDQGQFFLRFIIETWQYGHGYVVGTRGAATNVRVRFGSGTEPADFVEGEALGDTLEPQSLYEDQLARRLGPPPVVDAGVLPDASRVDASIVIADAAIPDAFVRDAGARDATIRADAATTSPSDAAGVGPRSDAGAVIETTPDASTSTTTNTCRCADSSTSTGWWSVLSILVFRARRRLPHR